MPTKITKTVIKMNKNWQNKTAKTLTEIEIKIII